MAVTARVSKSGQVTIPAEIREKLGLKPGDTVIWEFDDSNKATVRPVKYTFEELEGILGAFPGGMDIDDAINDAVHEGIERRHRRVFGKKRDPLQIG